MTVQAERVLQQEITLRLRAGGWPVIAFGVPNGIYVPARTEAERALVARIINRLKADGQLTPGAPDLCLFWHGGGAMVELKRPKSRDLLSTRAAGRPTNAQAEMAERAAAIGINHAFVTSWDELSERLTAWGVTRAAGPLLAETSA